MGLYESCQRNIPLSAVSTFGIGGLAQWFFRANTAEDLRKALSFALREQCPFFVLGRGSNCLFSDDGFSGLVIQNRVESLQDEGDGRFVVSSGYPFAALGVKTAREGWGGLEFAAGIPGSVGGAVFMNASSHGLQTADTVSWVEYVDETGALVRALQDQAAFGYRQSMFQGNRSVVTSVCFQLKKDEGAAARQREMVEYRKKTQPYKERSAGCIFRNPPGMSAGKLIEEVGLKGAEVGGAQVSFCHANFIVNKGGATARDVIELMHHVREVVAEKKGVWLESEICIIPSGST